MKEAKGNRIQMGRLIAILVVVFLLALNGCVTVNNKPAEESDTASSVPSSSPVKILTMDEAHLAVLDYLDSLALTADAKIILDEFYNNFYHCETYIWQNSNLIEVNFDKDYSGVSFDFYEIARFPMPSNPEGGTFILPEIFKNNFTEALETIHPAKDGSEAYREKTIAVRWMIDAHTGQVRTANANALRLEALLVGDSK